MRAKSPKASTPMISPIGTPAKREEHFTNDLSLAAVVNTTEPEDLARPLESSPPQQNHIDAQPAVQVKVEAPSENMGDSQHYATAHDISQDVTNRSQIMDSMVVEVGTPGGKGNITTNDSVIVNEETNKEPTVSEKDNKVWPSSKR